MPNQITLTSGTWLISAYVQYYSTAGQTNPLAIANVCYYIGGTSSQIVDGCVFSGTLPSVASMYIYQLSCPMQPLVLTSSNSFCLSVYISISRVFYVYQWGIKAVRIA